MDPFVAEIRIFPFNFAPVGWARCDGQLLPIAQNLALFSLLGTTYGGDGRATFALPDLTGRAPMHPGQGPGLSLHDLGESGGAETVSLLEIEIPAHTHTVNVATYADDNDPGGKALATTTATNLYGAPGGLGQQPFETVTASGGDLPHNNMMPYLTLPFCIAMQGVYPPRT